MSRDSLATDSRQDQKGICLDIERKHIDKTFIRTGLEDGTQVQVLSGLTPNDEIVDGVQQAGVKANSNNNQRSPFMPQRRSGQGNNRPAGSGQGGGSRPG
jgi:HlyD family secretion protein